MLMITMSTVSVDAADLTAANDDDDCRYSVCMGVFLHLLTHWIMSEHWTESKKFLMRYASFIFT